MIVVDTGPLFASMDEQDDFHSECKQLLRELPEELVVPLSVVIETSWLIERSFGARAEERFLDGIASSDMVIEGLGTDDLRRMADLIGTYDDLRLGVIDASVVTVAERVGASTLLTLDRRHFSVVRPRHTAAFVLLP